MASTSKKGISREKIISAALDLLRRGEGLSVRNIAPEVGIKFPTVYHHFKNIEALMHALGERINSDDDMLSYTRHCVKIGVAPNLSVDDGELMQLIFEAVMGRKFGSEERLEKEIENL